MTTKNIIFHYDAFGNTVSISAKQTQRAILDNNFTNKGSAFTPEERTELGLDGMLPPAVTTLEEQVAKCTKEIDAINDAYDQYLYISTLYDTNAVLAHALVASDIRRFMAIVYTPTVGQACQEYSDHFMQAKGLHFYPGNIDRAEAILQQMAGRDIRVAVVTDNQGILGIGDQGAGGLAISIGKLMLYTQGAGIAPWHCLPVSLDVGTDNQALIDNPGYLGWRHPRLTGSEYFDFIDQFALAFKKVFPNALCQWEDFSKQNAFTVKETYENTMISFNDDIQGTGSVTLAGIIAAMKVKKESLKDQVYLIHGAGAGGVGIGEQIEAALLEEGLSPEAAKRKIITLDSRGVVTTDRSLEKYKEKFAKDPNDLTWLNSPEDNTLLNAVTHEKVTVLIGTSGQPGCFTRDVIEQVARNTERPVIFPLSNPTVKAEALPADIYQWTNGKALVATGSPFEPVMHNGNTFRIGQCNNVFIFPGVGLGVVASGASKVLPSFFTAAAHAASEYLSDKDLETGTLFPPVEDLAKVSMIVAKRVAEAALKEGVASPSKALYGSNVETIVANIEKMAWQPVYVPVKRQQ